MTCKQTLLWAYFESLTLIGSNPLLCMTEVPSLLLPLFDLYIEVRLQCAVPLLIIPNTRGDWVSRTATPSNLQQRPIHYFACIRSLNRSHHDNNHAEKLRDAVQPLHDGAPFSILEPGDSNSSQHATVNVWFTNAGLDPCEESLLLSLGNTSILDLPHSGPLHEPPQLL